MLDAPPALVQEAPAPHPALAAGISLVAPAAVALGVGFGLSRFGLYPLNPVLALASTAGFGAGQVYAGDPVRGLLVGAGAPVAVVGGGFLGGLAALALSPGTDPFGTHLGGALIGAGLGFVGYGGWAAADAYATADRLNASRNVP